MLAATYAAVLLALVLGFSLASTATGELLGLAGISAVAAGKFLPLWAATGRSHFGAYELGLLVWLLDTFTVINIVYGLELFCRFGPLKRGLDKVRRNARLVLRAYPHFRRGAIVGIVVFVLFPVAGTGAIGGSFIGILLGLQRHVLIAAVSLGGLIGGGLMAVASVHSQGAVRALLQMQEGAAVGYVLIGVVVGIVLGLFWWLHHAYQRVLKDAGRADLDG